MSRLLSIARTWIVFDLMQSTFRLPRYKARKWAHPRALRLFLLTTVLFALEVYLVIKFFF